MKRRGPFPVTRAPSVTVTDETEYTCDNCSRTFPINRELRRHLDSRDCA